MHIPRKSFPFYKGMCLTQKPAYVAVSHHRADQCPFQGQSSAELTTLQPIRANHNKLRSRDTREDLKNRSYQKCLPHCIDSELEGHDPEPLGQLCPVQSQTRQ